MSAPFTHFKHCPACGSAQAKISDRNLDCPACGFLYFFNPTIAVMGFIENSRGELLLIERGKEPAMGKLAPPGGFIDNGESAEEGLSREVFEEVGLKVREWRYLCSSENQYLYRGVTYPVLDFAYTARIDSGSRLDLCPQEILSAKWVPINSIDADDLAFPSMRKAFRQLLAEKPSS